MTDYYSVIAQAVAGLPSNTDDARREIYNRARTALQERLRTLDPPISEAELANEQFVLEAAIRNVETKFLFSGIRRQAREEAAPPSSSFISRVNELERSVGAKLNNGRLDALTKLFLEKIDDAKRGLNSSIRCLLDRAQRG